MIFKFNGKIWMLINMHPLSLSLYPSRYIFPNPSTNFSIFGKYTVSLFFRSMDCHFYFLILLSSPVRYIHEPSLTWSILNCCMLTRLIDMVLQKPGNSSSWCHEGVTSSLLVFFPFSSIVLIFLIHIDNIIGVGND